MPEPFNLTTDPWIPLRGVRGGSRVEASLRDALTGAHEWAGYPDDDGQFGPAILRLLVVLAYQTTALGEASDEQEFEDALEETWALDQFDPQRVDRYLQTWRDEFWLFPPEGFTGHRWMQDRKLEELPTAGITASGLQPQASPSYAWGNQAVEPFSGPAAARALLAFMHYGRGGGGAKHPDGDPASPPRWQDGRMRGRASIHPIGRTLFDTLMLNTIPPDDGVLDRIGRPEWETGRPEATVPIGVPTSLLEQLSGRWEKAAWLHQAKDGTVAEVCLTAARRRPDEVAEADPYTILKLVERREDKQLIPVPLRSTPGKAVWRDFPSLKAQSETARHETHILRSLQQFSRRAARQKVASWVIAAHRPDNAKDKGWDISFISPTALLHPTTEDAISLFVDIAEGSAKKLRQETKFFLSEAGCEQDPQKARVRRAERLFWSSMEAEFRQVVARPDDRAAMQSAVLDAALRAYDAAVDVSAGAAADYRGHKDKQPAILPVAVSRQRHRHRLTSAIRKLCEEKEQHDRA